MRETFVNGHSRREFLGHCLPACAATCLGLSALPSLGRSQTAASQAPAGHKFDTETPGKLTMRLLFVHRYGSIFIPFVKFCVEALGRNKTIEMLKAYADSSAVLSAERLARRLGTNEFEAARKYFDPSLPAFANTMTFARQDTSEREFSLRVTECLWAATFREAKAGDLGYAAICHPDFQLAKAFNPRLELIRTKTLMEGADCCNHRYIYK